MDTTPIVLPTNTQSILNEKLYEGNVVRAEIKESLIAFSDGKAPIRAVIESGSLKNSVLLGDATLEKNSKRILISFTTLVTQSPNKSWSLKSHALDQKGILGIEGSVITDEEKFFAAEFLTALASGFTDSTIERSVNENGNYIEKPGMDTNTKKALATALSRSTEHFAGHLKNTSIYALLEGPTTIQILVTETPTLNP